MIDLPLRFWRKVKINPCTQCWEWQAGLTKDGYGRFWYDNKWQATHRLTKQTPINKHTDHLCKNRKCCNPLHLDVVTALENNHRALPWAYQTSKTHCKHGHEFTPENTYIRKGKWRSCRACQKGYIKF